MKGNAHILTNNPRPSWQPALPWVHMLFSGRARCHPRRLFVLAWALTALSTAMAAEKVAHIGYVYPAGGRQGTTVVVKIGGENVYGAKTALVSGAGVMAQILDSKDPNEGQLDPKKKNKKKNEAVIDEIVTVKVVIAPDAEPGPRDICLATPDMMSNKLIFQVGELDELPEKEPNNTLKDATPVGTLPALVQGQIMPGDVDWYKFHALKGQHLVVDVAARALLPYIADGVPGWFQAIVALTDAAGNEVAVADDFRFSQDPVLFYDVPKDGEYGLSIRDTIYRGREDFVYRMRVGELPFITSVSPLGAQTATNPVSVRLSGVNLASNSIVVATGSQAPSCRPIAVVNGPLHSNSRLFAVGGIPEQGETSPALKAGRARTLVMPVVVDGCIRMPSEKHFYRFKGKQGQAIRLEVMARRLGSPLDSCLVLQDDNGRKLAENDDMKDKGEGFITHQSDSGMTCVLPRDGSYTVMLYDMQGRGGDDYVYRLRVSPPLPDFELRVTPAAVKLSQGGAAPLTVHVIRRDGFDGEVRLRLDGPVDGVSLDAFRIPAGMDKIMTTVSASKNAMGRFALRIQGAAVVGGKTIVHEAVPAEILMQAFLYQHLFPFHEETVLVTPPPAPFHVVLGLPADGILALPLGKETRIPVSATRRPGYNGPIRLQFLEAPKGVTFRNAFIPADKPSASIVIRVESKVETNWQGNLVFTGSMPVEREATPEEKVWMAKKAAREKEARSAVIGATNAAVVVAASTNAVAAGGAAPGDTREKPVMVTRPVVMVFPAVPYRIIEKSIQENPVSQPGNPRKSKPNHAKYQ